MTKTNKTLVCLSNDIEFFTYGNLYDIYITDSNESIEWKQYIYGDNGINYFYHKSIFQDRFIPINEYREKQLNKILDNE
jgi:hypothetical protein